MIIITAAGLAVTVSARFSAVAIRAAAATVTRPGTRCGNLKSGQAAAAARLEVTVTSHGPGARSGAGLLSLALVTEYFRLHMPLEFRPDILFFL